MKIKSIFNNNVLFEADVQTLKECIELAVKAGSDLSYATLSHANLSHANLSHANLSDATLSYADLTILNIPSQRYYITVINESIKIGCKCHTIEEWENFTNREILAMDGKDALIFWKDYKDAVISTAKLHIKTIKKLTQPKS